MKKFTEKEALQVQAANLNYCSLLEKEGVIKIDELSELIPGYIHLNNRKTIAMEYVSRNGLEVFQKSIEEIQSLGREFVNEIIDKKSQHIISTSLVDFSNNGNEDGHFNFFQRVRFNKKEPFKLYFTVTKKYRNNTSLISYSQPISKLDSGSYLKEIVEERYNFFNKNHHKFTLLTKREKEIICLIVNGDSNRQIAEKLYISYHTVKTHRKNILKKLETSSLVYLVDFYRVFLSN